MKQFTFSQITNAADVKQLAHHIVYDLHRPDYHPDDHFGLTEIDRLVDEAFAACGDEVYGVFYEECYGFLKQARRQENS